MKIERIEIRSEFITTLTLENAIVSPTNGEPFGGGDTGGAT